MGDFFSYFYVCVLLLSFVFRNFSAKFFTRTKTTKKKKVFTMAWKQHNNNNNKMEILQECKNKKNNLKVFLFPIIALKNASRGGTFFLLHIKEFPQHQNASSSLSFFGPKESDIIIYIFFVNLFNIFVSFFFNRERKKNSLKMNCEVIYGFHEAKEQQIAVIWNGKKK